MGPRFKIYSMWPQCRKYYWAGSIHLNSKIIPIFNCWISMSITINRSRLWIFKYNRTMFYITYMVTKISGTKRAFSSIVRIEEKVIYFHRKLVRIQICNKRIRKWSNWEYCCYNRRSKAIWIWWLSTKEVENGRRFLEIIICYGPQISHYIIRMCMISMKIHTTWKPINFIQPHIRSIIVYKLIFF